MDVDATKVHLANFISQIDLFLAKKVNEKGINGLSPPERVVLFSLGAKGIIDNGGFQYFYEGASNIEEVAVAFDTLGLSEAAQACRKSAVLFPNGIVPDDQTERFKCLEKQPEEWETLFDQLDPLIWNITDELEKALLIYVQCHQNEIQIG